MKRCWAGSASSGNHKSTLRLQAVACFQGCGDLLQKLGQRVGLRLAEGFQLPTKRRIKKLSLGQRSAVGVIDGLAPRAELRFLDEPCLGLDAVARQLFYHRLLADCGESPRTIVLSSHLIDDVANLLEHVVIIDKGRIIVDDDAEDIRGQAVNVAGTATRVQAFGASRTVLQREQHPAPCGRSPLREP